MDLVYFDGIRSLGLQVLRRVLPVLAHRTIDVVPAVRRSLLPFSIVASIDTAIAAGIDVAFHTLQRSRGSLPNSSSAPCARIGHAPSDTREFVAVSNRSRVPSPVDVASTTRDDDVSAWWIVAPPEIREFGVSFSLQCGGLDVFRDRADIGSPICALLPFTLRRGKQVG